MASGMPEAKWNNADIIVANADRAAIVDWYAERDVPWGLRVPLEVEFDLGEPLFVKRCAALVRESFKLAPRSSLSGVTVRRATRDDLGTYAAVELSRFGGTQATELAWLSPALGATNFTHWIAERSGAPIGVAMTIQTDERAGPAAYLGGVAAGPEEAGRDV